MNVTNTTTNLCSVQIELNVLILKKLKWIEYAAITRILKHRTENINRKKTTTKTVRMLSQHAGLKFRGRVKKNLKAQSVANCF